LVAVLAHPDDESFAIGGTLARYAAEGVAVDLILATDGEAGIPGTETRQAAEVRQSELLMACGALGVRYLEFLGFGDGHLSEIEEESAVARLLNSLRRVRPDVMITFGPDGISGHPDHLAVHRWTTAAFDRLSQLPGGPRRLYYIAPSPATEQGCGVPPAAESVGGPVAFIDVGRFLVAKVRAAQQHRSQHPPFSGKPEIEAQRLACHEVFRLARPISNDNTGAPVDDLFAGMDQASDFSESADKEAEREHTIP
jgi:LmbE family N-acetylglucosaminyl deacetylase